MTLLHGDNLALLATLPDNSIDAVVTDPPYGLGDPPDALAMLRDWLETGHHDVKSKRGFMGKAWDNFVPQPMQWREVYRVLKPGGHVLAFAGTRTQDLMSLGLRLAGFEIRDLVAWVYGSGFPKSLNVGKAIDATLLHGGSGSRQIKEANESRPGEGRTRSSTTNNGIMGDSHGEKVTRDDPATDAAKQWDGWGTALKPALEPITLARKPLEGTVAANVLKWHTGAINVDGCRVAHQSEADRASATPQGRVTAKAGALAGGTQHDGERDDFDRPDTSKGRWPANLIHDGSDEVVGLFPETKSGGTPKVRSTARTAGHSWGFASGDTDEAVTGNSGSAARFFYCAKVSPSERNAGLSELPDKEWKGDGAAIPQRGERPFNPSKNNHPTVKPIALMRYLCRLITPPGGSVLDPWMGSGSTGVACKEEGFRFLGMEQDEGYYTIARARCGVPKLSLEDIDV
jgi:site-specific DNA-methyltransferase (adenine-specific)